MVASLLIRALAVTYIDNFSAMFRRAPLTAARLSRSLGVVREGRSSLSNFYGNTAGISSPNDGFNIWNRWLGEDRYQPVTTVSDDAQVEMRRFFAAWSATFERPVSTRTTATSAASVCFQQRYPRRALFL